jgi:hypothetical protein
VSDTYDGTAWISYVGPLGSRPRKIKLNISDDERVESHRRLCLHRGGPIYPAEAAIEGYTLDEVGAEKLRCVAERLQCRDLYDLHELLDGQHIDALETWHLYLRKAANDVARGRQRTPPREWAATFDRRLAAYRDRWGQELGDYLSRVPGFGDVERWSRRHLGPVIAAARALAEQQPLANDAEPSCPRDPLGRPGHDEPVAQSPSHATWIKVTRVIDQSVQTIGNVLVVECHRVRVVPQRCRRVAVTEPGLSREEPCPGPRDG